CRATGARPPMARQRWRDAASGNADQPAAGAPPGGRQWDRRLRQRDLRPGHNRLSSFGPVRRALGWLALRRASAQFVRQRLVLGRELETDRIDAVALAGGRRAVIEDVALMRTAASADDFRPDHAVAGVADIFEMTLGKRLGEARPAGAAFELGTSVEQGKTAQPTGEDARALFVEADAAEGCLGAMLEQDVLFLLV